MCKTYKQMLKYTRHINICKNSTTPATLHPFLLVQILCDAAKRVPHCFVSIRANVLSLRVITRTEKKRSVVSQLHLKHHRLYRL